MKLNHTVLALVCLASAGFAQDVRYNYAADANFNQLKTYKWGSSRAEERLDQLTDRQLRDAVDGEMRKKGFVLADGGPADMLLVYEPSVRKEKQITMYHDNWGFGRGWGRRWYGYGGMGMGMGTTTAQTSTIKIGEFALDIYDTARHELVWRGVASKALDPNMKPDKWQKTIESGAQKLLKSFPPSKK